MLKKSLVVVAIASVIAVLRLPETLAQTTFTTGVPEATSAKVSEALPAFEVASVKPNKSNEDPFRVGFQPGGRFSALNVQVRYLIALAYGISQPLLRVVGGPDWLNTERFDIMAKAEADFSASPNGIPSELYPMLQNLLTERFKLTTHMETRQLDLYELVLARSDRQLGPRLSPASVDCDALRAANRGRGSGSRVPPPPQRGQRPTCGYGGSPGHFAGGGVTMTQLADALGGRVGRPVVDSTGLSGRFDLDLAFRPDQMPQEPLPPEAPPIDPNGPSIFTALQEQLGLKFVSRKGPTDVLVIDTVERPTPD